MIRTLIADDHGILRAGLKHILHETDDIVVEGEASDGGETLAQVRSGHWDVLVLDLSMPGRSGIELIKQIKAEYPRLAILVLSMYKEDIYAVRALKAGASGYLCKDNAEVQLVDAIRQVTSGQLFISPSVAERFTRDTLHGTTDESPHTHLSDREYQIFLLLVKGHSVTRIAQQLNLSVKTVSTHRTSILGKMGMTSTAELVSYAIRRELVEG